MRHPFDIKRVCLKITGESLMGKDSLLEKEAIEYVVNQIKILLQNNIQLSIVLGGGNFYRGTVGSEKGISPVISDQIGMLGTVMNALALYSYLQQLKIPSSLYSSFSVAGIVSEFDFQQSLEDFNQGKVVIFCGGIGNPYFTTDTACVIRALEMQADFLLKGTKVDGIYDKDPISFKEAKKFSLLSYKKVLENQYQVMDQTAFTLCNQHKLPLAIFNFFDPQAIQKIIQGEISGTLVFHEEEFVRFQLNEE